MASLYQLTGEMMQLLDMLSDPDADQECVKDTLEGVQYEFETKAESYVFVLRQLEADCSDYKTEEELFARKRKVCENSIQRLKEALKTALVQTGHENGMDAGVFKLKVSKNGGKRSIVYDADVPENYTKVKTEIDTDKVRAYLEGLKNPAACAWAHLAEQGTHVSIK